MTLRVFRKPLHVIASSCEAIQGNKEAWIASSQGLLAMTLKGWCVIACKSKMLAFQRRLPFK
jgi:hypothetical protein